MNANPLCNVKDALFVSFTAVIHEGIFCRGSVVPLIDMFLCYANVNCLIIYEIFYSLYNFPKIFRGVKKNYVGHTCHYLVR
jgi:hypothetical protein